MSSAVWYHMPKEYTAALSAVLCLNPDVKRSEVRDKMIPDLRLMDKALPSGFPSEDQVKRHVASVKYNQQKRKKKGKKYIYNCFVYVWMFFH